MKDFFDANIFMGSGLLSAPNYDWQHGLRWCAREIGDVPFQSSMSGFEGIDEAVASILSRGVRAVMSIGHSNWNYFSTELARRLEPKGVAVYIGCFDRTMKSCPKLQGNVPQAIDIWAGPPMKRLEPGGRFKGNLVKHQFPEESHLSIINNRRALNLMVAWARQWKGHLG